MATYFQQCQGPGEENVNSGPSKTDYIGTGSWYVCFLSVHAFLNSFPKQNLQKIGI